MEQTTTTGKHHGKFQVHFRDRLHRIPLIAEAALQHARTRQPMGVVVMGWLLSAGELGVKRATPMRIAASEAKRAWVFGESARHNVFMANGSLQATAKVWKAVLDDLTEQAKIEQEHKNEH